MSDLLQHTPAGRATLLQQIHDNDTNDVEFSTHQQFGEIIGPYLIGRTVHHGNQSLVNLVGNIEKFDVKMTSLFSRTGLTIFLQFDCRLVVLQNTTFCDDNVLGLQEVTGPQNNTHKIVHSGKFSFCETSGIDLLLQTPRDNSTFSHH